MAGAHCATVSALTPPTNLTTTRRKKPLLFASLPTPKPTKRKNYLRPKILKTLTKPPPNPIIPTISLEPETPPQYDLVFESPTSDETSPENCTAVSGEDDKVEEIRVSEASGTANEFDGIVGKFSARSVLKYGAYLVGIFVFQTIFSVLVLGYNNSDVKNGNLENSDSDIDVKDKGKSLLDKNGRRRSNVVYESELEERIEEIRAMAREARQSEAKKVKEDVYDDEISEESVISRRRIGIEREIGAKLFTLQKRLNSARDKVPVPGAYVDGLRKSTKVEEDEVDKDVLDSKGGSGMYKKKSKFKSPSTKPVNGPKGFGDRSVINRRKSGSARESVGDGGMELLEGSDYQTLDEDDGRNGSSSAEVLNSRKSGKLARQYSQRNTKGNQETITKSDKSDVLSINGSLNHKVVGDEPVANKLRKKQPNTGTKWWSSLPYVLAIYMRKGSDHEGQGGVYTLKSASQAQDQNDSSYTVAFEDRIDANNFCFLLESFFEDLGDFSADIVPLSVKELHEAVKANTMKVIVVKKRQLQLYAGQPFADVEMALRSLVE